MSSAKRFTFEKPGKQRDSVRQARGEFLGFIPDLRPDVIADLQATALVDFAFAVAEQFQDQLLDDPTKSLSGKEVLLSLVNRPMRKQEARPVLTELTKEMQDLLSAEIPTFVTLHLDGLLSEPLLIRLVDQTVSRTLRYFHKLDEPQVRKAFPNFRALARRRRTQELHKKLLKWAASWNLNVDWCLDNALKVLRYWLLDKQLPSAFVISYSDAPDFGYRHRTRLIAGWRFVATMMKLGAVASQARLSFEVHGGDPKQFAFEYEAFHFEYLGWDFLRNTKEEWKAKAEREFDLAVSELRSSGKVMPKGIRTSLRKDLVQYLKECDREKSAAINQHGLVKVQRHIARTHRQADHFTWLVRYQIPHCEPYPQIAKTDSENSETIRKYVEVTAKLIDLKLRDPRLHAGRTVGSTGTASRRTRFREVSPRRKAKCG